MEFDIEGIPRKEETKSPFKDVPPLEGIRMDPRSDQRYESRRRQQLHIDGSYREKNKGSESKKGISF